MVVVGKVFDFFFLIGYVLGVFIGVVVMFFYMVVGGFKVVVYSDFV